MPKRGKRKAGHGPGHPEHPFSSRPAPRGRLGSRGNAPPGAYAPGAQGPNGPYSAGAYGSLDAHSPRIYGPGGPYGPPGSNVPPGAQRRLDSYGIPRHQLPEGYGALPTGAIGARPMSDQGPTVWPVWDTGGPGHQPWEDVRPKQAPKGHPRSSNMPPDRGRPPPKGNKKRQASQERQEMKRRKREDFLERERQKKEAKKQKGNKGKKKPPPSRQDSRDIDNGMRHPSYPGQGAEPQVYYVDEMNGGVPVSSPYPGSGSRSHESNPYDNPYRQGPNPYDNPYGQGPNPYDNPYGQGPNPYDNPYRQGPNPYDNPYRQEPTPYNNAYGSNGNNFHGMMGQYNTPSRPLTRAPTISAPQDVGDMALRRRFYGLDLVAALGHQVDLPEGRRPRTNFFKRKGGKKKKRQSEKTQQELEEEQNEKLHVRHGRAVWAHDIDRFALIRR